MLGLYDTRFVAVKPERPVGQKERCTTSGDRKKVVV
jgi:hypothetical protein